jgi:hypothetical protein
VLTLSVLVTNDPTLSAPVDVMSPMFDRLRLLKLRGLKESVDVMLSTLSVPLV